MSAISGQVPPPVPNCHCTPRHCTQLFCDGADDVDFDEQFAWPASPKGFAICLPHQLELLGNNNVNLQKILIYENQLKLIHSTLLSQQFSQIKYQVERKVELWRKIRTRALGVQKIPHKKVSGIWESDSPISHQRLVFRNLTTT